MDENMAALAAQSFAYEVREGSAVILRCFSRDSKAEIPDEIEGYPVREIAPYAFSAHLDGGGLLEAVRTGRARMYVPEALPGGGEAGSGSAPALCGDRLEEISLPQGLRRVGRYCFYNCSSLRRIEFYGALSDWGSGVFTGCHRVKELRVYADAEGRSHLKDVLDELHEELTVEYHMRAGSAREAGSAAPGPDGWEQVRLVFPEFYEEGVENTPARILETHVHGSGILYRNCFQGRAFDFAQYDVLFPYARAQERMELAAEMAAARLRFPHELTEKARRQYEDFAAGHAWEIAREMLAQKDPEGLRWLLALVRQRPGSPAQGEVPYEELLERVLEEAARLRDAEAVSFLMEQARGAKKERAAGRKRMEL